MKTESLKFSQIQLLFVSSILSDCILFSFDSDMQFIAHERIWALIINTIVLIILTFLLFYKVNTNYSGKFWLFTAFLAYLLASADSFLNAENFYRFTQNAPISGFLIIVLVLIIALYILQCKGNTLARASGLLMWIFIFAFVLILITVVKKMDVYNLQPHFKGQYGIFVTSVMTFKFPVSLLLFGSMPTQTIKTIPVKKIISVIMVLFVVQVCFILAPELVFSNQINMYTQPVYALARTGGFSVFKNMQAFYTVIWLLAILQKAYILFFAAISSLNRCVNFKNNSYKNASYFIIIFSAIIIVSYIPSNIFLIINLVLSAFSACVLCVMARCQQ